MKDDTNNNEPLYYEIRQQEIHFTTCLDPKCNLCDVGRSTEKPFILEKFSKLNPNRMISILYSFTSSNINQHIYSLRNRICNSTKYELLKTHFSPFIASLIQNKLFSPFIKPVDCIKDGVNDYYLKIKSPIDLSTMKSKLEQGLYASPDDICNDVKLMIKNALDYYPADHQVHNICQELKRVFDQNYNNALNKYTKSRKKEDLEISNHSCNLCKEAALYYESPYYVCNSCNLRVKSNVFYVHPDNTIHYCKTCFNKFVDPIVIGTYTYAKSIFYQQKCCDLFEEPWVCCSFCNKWYHQICTAFNSRAGSNEEIYACPLCLQYYLESKSLNLPYMNEYPWEARLLPHTQLSKHLEDQLYKCIDELRREEAKAKMIPLDDVVPCTGFSVRILSSLDRVYSPNRKIIDYIKTTNTIYPSQFTVNTKCIGLFQKIDNIDVLLFVLYVDEFNDQCPEPNKRRSYLSYLDSVKYLQPPHYRTRIFKYLIYSYICYIQMMGFISFHIWACPPSRGDDYIIHSHPKDQKIPKVERLKRWYENIIEHAVSTLKGVRRSTFYDEFMNQKLYPFRKKSPTLSSLPYFEGDFWTLLDITATVKSTNKKTKNNPTLKRRKTGKKNPNNDNDNQLNSSYNTNTYTRSSELYYKELTDQVQSQKEYHLYCHLHYICILCGEYIFDKIRWECKDCRYVLCCNCHSRNSQSHNHTLSRENTEINLVIEDKTPLISSLFDSRREFLSFCLSNHYQFNQLRRAKHSTLMILYHLHNPGASLYPSKCNSCSLDLTSEYYHCDECNNFDLCKQCYNLKPHNHDLHHMVGITFDKILPSESLTNILEILNHMYNCKEILCQNIYHRNNLTLIMKHVTQCKFKQCQTCLSYNRILNLHTMKCQLINCPVFKCNSQRALNSDRIAQENQLRLRDFKNKNIESEDK